MRCLLLLAAAVLAGCNSAPQNESASTGDSRPSTAGSSASSALARFVLKGEPQNAKSILKSREKVKDGDEVVLIGRVGGTESPIVKGRGTFTIADTSFKPCNETGDDSCPTPWDYCCTEDVHKGLATVKLVGEDGKTVQEDVRETLGLKELKTVVVQGKARRDKAGNLTVLATGIYVRP